MDIEKIILNIIEGLANNRALSHSKDNWLAGGRYLNIKNLNNDDTGEVGELLLNDIFSRYDYNVKFEKAVTSRDKDWDIIIDNIKIEVKTATIGRSSDTFQHEKFFKNRTYDAVCLLDFTPNELYITLAREDDIVWEELHARATNGVLTGEYKFDLSLSALKRGDTPKLKDCFISLISSEEDMVNLFNQFKNKFYKIDHSNEMIKTPYVSNTEMISIPLVGSAPCGEPMFREQNIEKMIEVEKNKIKTGFNYFILKAKGDSMNEAGIQDGDLVLCRQQLKADIGERVVALVDDNVTIKMYDKKDGRRILLPKSSNQEHKPIIPQEGDTVQGVVQEVLKYKNIN